MLNMSSFTKPDFALFEKLIMDAAMAAEAKWDMPARISARTQAAFHYAVATEIFETGGYTHKELMEGGVRTMMGVLRAALAQVRETNPEFEGDARTLMINMLSAAIMRMLEGVGQCQTHVGNYGEESSGSA